MTVMQIQIDFSQLNYGLKLITAQILFHQTWGTKFTTQNNT